MVCENERGRIGGVRIDRARLERGLGRGVLCLRSDTKSLMEDGGREGGWEYFVSVPAVLVTR
jgi:hypothetical protein